MPFEPGARVRGRALEPFVGGVPQRLHGAMWDWCKDRFTDLTRLRLFCVEFGVEPSAVRWELRDIVIDRIGDHCASNEDFFLEAVEYLVAHAGDDSNLAVLERILEAAHSIWTVRDGQLGYRVDPTTQIRIADAVAAAAEGPAHWLTEAWNDAYARTARPGPSYDASIKAVEGALRVIVIPKSGRATITQIINALRDGRHNFEFDIQDSRGAAAGANEPPIDTIETILAMLRALAYGQKTRHGDSGDVTVNTVEEARAAVQLATTLVHFATTGALKRR